MFNNYWHYRFIDPEKFGLDECRTAICLTKDYFYQRIFSKTHQLFIEKNQILPGSTVVVVVVLAVVVVVVLVLVLEVVLVLVVVLAVVLVVVLVVVSEKEVTTITYTPPFFLLQSIFYSSINLYKDECLSACSLCVITSHDRFR